VAYIPQQQSGLLVWDLYVRSNRDGSKKFVNLPTFIYADKKRITVKYNGTLLQECDLMHSGALTHKSVFLDDIPIDHDVLIDRIILPDDIPINDKITVSYEERAITLKPVIEFFCYDKYALSFLEKPHVVPSGILAQSYICQRDRRLAYNNVQYVGKTVLQYLPNTAYFTNYPVNYMFSENNMMAEAFSVNNETGKEIAVAYFTKNYFELFSLVYEKGQKYKQTLKFRIRDLVDNTVSEWAPYGLQIAGPLPWYGVESTGFYKVAQIIKL